VLLTTDGLPSPELTTASAKTALNPPVFVRPEVHTPTIFAAGICVRLAAEP